MDSLLALNSGIRSHARSLDCRIASVSPVQAWLRPSVAGVIALAGVAKSMATRTCHDKNPKGDGPL